MIAAQSSLSDAPAVTSGLPEFATRVRFRFACLAARFSHRVSAVAYDLATRTIHLSAIAAGSKGLGASEEGYRDYKATYRHQQHAHSKAPSNDPRLSSLYRT